MSARDDDVTIVLVGSVASTVLSARSAMERAGLPVVVIEANEHSACDCAMQPMPEPIAWALDA